VAAGQTAVEEIKTFEFRLVDVFMYVKTPFLLLRIQIRFIIIRQCFSSKVQVVLRQIVAKKVT